MQPLLRALSSGTSDYEFTDYSLTLTLPASTVSREYALHCHLLDVHKYAFVLFKSFEMASVDLIFAFRDIAEFKEWDEVIDIKEAIKWILGHELRRLLNLRFSRTVCNEGDREVQFC